jgi:hypothetical protein
MPDAQNTASTTELWEILRVAARWCPSHRMPDCSPLLNGCSVVNNRVAALDSLRSRMEWLGALEAELREANQNLAAKVERMEQDNESWRTVAGLARTLLRHHEPDRADRLLTAVLEHKRPEEAHA